MKNLFMSLVVLATFSGVSLAEDTSPTTATQTGTVFSLPDGFLGDLLASFGFGLVAVLVVVLGFKLFDKLTPGCQFMPEVQKGNIAAAVVSSAVILGLCYAVAHIAPAIIGQ